MRHKYHYLYNTSEWRRLRRQQLEAEPLCWYCLLAGGVNEADTVDHIKPHKGDKSLFFNPDNLRSSCKHCHDTTAAVKDRVGFVPGSGVDGMPVDKSHPFYGGV